MLLFMYEMYESEWLATDMFLFMVCSLGHSLCRDSIMLMCETKIIIFSLVSFTHIVWP